MELDIISIMKNIERKCSHLIHSTDFTDGDKHSLYIVSLFEADHASINEIKEVFDVVIKELEDYGFIMVSNTIRPTKWEGLEYWLEFVPRTKNAIIDYLNNKRGIDKIDNLEEKSLAELITIIEQLNNR